MRAAKHHRPQSISKGGVDSAAWEEAFQSAMEVQNYRLEADAVNTLPPVTNEEEGEDGQSNNEELYEDDFIKPVISYKEDPFPRMKIDPALQFFAEEVDLIDPTNHLIPSPLHQYSSPKIFHRSLDNLAKRTTKKSLASNKATENRLENIRKTQEALEKLPASLNPYKKANIVYINQLSKPKKSVEDQMRATSLNRLQNRKHVHRPKSRNANDVEEQLREREQQWQDITHKSYSSENNGRQGNTRYTRNDVLERIYDNASNQKGEISQAPRNSNNNSPQQEMQPLPHRPSSVGSSRSNMQRPGSVARRIVAPPNDNHTINSGNNNNDSNGNAGSNVIHAPPPAAIHPETNVSKVNEQPQGEHVYGAFHAGSKPLAWSKSFGEKGRERVKKMIEKQKQVQAKRQSLLENHTISTMPHDFLDIYFEIIKYVGVYVDSLLHKSMAFAADYCYEVQSHLLLKANDPATASSTERKWIFQQMDAILLYPHAPSATDAQQLQGTYFPETSSAYYFHQLLTLCSQTVINVRPSTEAALALAWVLNQFVYAENDNPSDQFAPSINVMARFLNEYQLVLQEVRTHLARITFAAFDRSVNRDKDEKKIHRQFRLYFRDAPYRIYANQGEIPKDWLRHKTSDNHHSHNNQQQTHSSPSFSKVNSFQFHNDHSFNHFQHHESNRTENRRASSPTRSPAETKNETTLSPTSATTTTRNYDYYSPPFRPIEATSQQIGGVKSQSAFRQAAAIYAPSALSSVSSSSKRDPAKSTELSSNAIIAAIQPMRPSSAGPIRTLGMQASLSATRQHSLPANTVPINHNNGIDQDHRPSDNLTNNNITPRKPRSLSKEAESQAEKLFSREYSSPLSPSHEMIHNADIGHDHIRYNDSMISSAAASLKKKHKTDHANNTDLNVIAAAAAAKRKSRTKKLDMLRVNVHLHMGLDIYLRAFQPEKYAGLPLPAISHVPWEENESLDDQSSAAVSHGRVRHTGENMVPLPSHCLTNEQRQSILALRQVQYDRIRRPDIPLSRIVRSTRPAPASHREPHADEDDGNESFVTQYPRNQANDHREDNEGGSYAIPTQQALSMLQQEATANNPATDKGNVQDNENAANVSRTSLATIDSRTLFAPGTQPVSDDELEGLLGFDFHDGAVNDNFNPEVSNDKSNVNRNINDVDPNVKDDKVSHKELPHHTNINDNDHHIRDSVDGDNDTDDVDERSPFPLDEIAFLFFQQAPHVLTGEQRSMLRFAIVSDIIRSVTLQIVVLLRHSIAGHVVRPRDLQTIFGPSVASPSVLPPPLLHALHNWLQCNRRTRDNILRPTTHPAYLEQAMLRLYGLWPSLQIEELMQANPTRVKERAFSLIWENRLQNKNAFRSPDMYQPNLNKI